GRVFDFISRTTPTGGEDFTFLRQILSGRATPSSVLGQTDRNSGPGF
ncbi:MAG: outer membrane protein assembly factor BamE, partial [Pseudomonadota bacterium]